MMKKRIICLVLALIMAFAVTGCKNTENDTKTTGGVQSPVQTDEPSSPEPTAPAAPDATEAYGDLLDKYHSALSEKWGGGDLNQNNMSLMISDCYGLAPADNIGYALQDLDGNGVQELIIAATQAITDDYYGKIVFDVYTLDQSGSPVKVLTSTDRDRYYYAGENRFANLGSNGAGETIDTTWKFENGKLSDMKSATAPADYVQLELIRMI